MKKLLIISNGHGEDIVAREIIKKLPRQIEIDAFPLVGNGERFKDLSLNMIGPLKDFPSGGFSLRNLLALPRDIRDGYLDHARDQWEALNSIKEKYNLTVAIGDLISLIAAIRVAGPFIFVGVNKSDYYHTFGYSYTPWEKWLLKRAKIVFTRDRITATNLNRTGINAIYTGNPIMDCIGEMPKKIEGGKTIGFLPGTRGEDLSLNIYDFYQIAIELKKLYKDFHFLIATKAEAPPCFEKRPFAEVISRSEIIVGLSGTGNEQAAGMGKPVVAFPGRGSQYTARFARAQKQLLSEALCLKERNPVKIAEEVWSIYNDHGRFNYMSHTGLERMGKPGAIPAIVQYIIWELK